MEEVVEMEKSKKTKNWKKSVASYLNASFLFKNIGRAIKASVVNDTPPGEALDMGELSPTMAKYKDLSERHTLTSLMPYESYDEETGLYFNEDSIGFNIFCIAATGLDDEKLAIINGIYNQTHKAGTLIQVSLFTDPNIEPLLEEWRNNKFNVSDPEVLEIIKLLANNRVNYLKQGKWESLFGDHNHLLKDF